MNKAIGRVFVVGVILFVAVIVNLTYLQVIHADELAQRPENKRQLAEELRIKRGSILGYDGSVIARSVRRSGFYQRRYPQGTVAPQLVGYDTVRYGRSGIEEQMNDELLGRAPELGVQSWVDQLLGRRPTGADVVTTLVPDVQRVAQRALSGKTGAIVVMDPATGALIANASAPNYDPRTLEDEWKELRADPDAPLLDRPLQGLYAPGSSFKVVTAAGGLGRGLVTPDTRFVDTGTFVIYGGKVTNYGGAVYGPHDFETALTLSINTTFGKVGDRLGRRRLVETMRAFGFWEVPPIELPSGAVVASGRYDDEGLLSPEAAMDPLAVAWAACGQEQVLATPLQMALVASAVANGGTVMRPYVVQEVRPADGGVVEQATPAEWLTAIEPATALTLNTMMQRVVTSGTGTGAAIEGVSVAGKTGTAERGDGTNLAWFIGFAPADDPRVAVAVVVEDTLSTGGAEAAPLAADVLRSALNQARLP
jgi:peptidoglycan glycosyltransferase